MRTFVENDIYTLAATSSAFIILFLLERWFPLRKPTQSLFPRLKTNFLLACTAAVVTFILVKPAALKAFAISAQYKFGVLSFFEMSPVSNFLASFLLLDASYYYWHRLNHNSRFLWRFHKVHHYDPDIDSSSAFRFHLGEVAFSSFFRVAQIILIGPYWVTYLTYELVFRLANLFHHSNIGLPKKLDDMIKLIFVTPRMHGIHHSTERDETNSNYSVVFNIWDRLHGSFVNTHRAKTLKIGLEEYASPKHNHFKNAFLDPFKK